MGVPKSVVKFKKNGIEYVSNVDRINYTINELTRAALRDTGKFICKNAKAFIKKRTGRGAKNVQYWVRSKQPSPNLQVGIKPGGFYIGFMETGTSKQPKIGALERATVENIEEIRKIQAMYLSAIEEENRALGLIEEEEMQGE